MARQLPHRLLIAFAVLFGAAGCGHALPRPELVAQPGRVDDWTIVPYPPPPARVEVVPPAPRRDVVWVDGEWRWEGRRWIWHLGGWFAAGTALRHAPWDLQRLPDGLLRWAPGAWLDAAGRPAPEPPLVLPASSTSML